MYIKKLQLLYEKIEILVKNMINMKQLTELGRVKGKLSADYFIKKDVSEEIDVTLATLTQNPSILRAHMNKIVVISLKEDVGSSTVKLILNMKEEMITDCLNTIKNT